MIGFLRGVLRDAGNGNWVMIDGGGVGWLVTPTFVPEAGAELEVWVTTTWRDVAGPSFWAHLDIEARDAFEALCAVHGVGPGTAAGIVATLGAAGLALAVTTNDTAAFKGVRGVGPKVAARVLADVKLPDRLLDRIGDVAVQPVDEDQHDELATALVALGFDLGEADRAVSEVRRSTPDASDDEVLSAALVRLAA